MEAALRCGGGAAAFPVAQRIAAIRNGDGRGTILALRRGGLNKGEFALRVSSSPTSWSPWAVRCSPGPAPTISLVEQQRKRALEALKAAFADMFRPLLRNMADMLSLSTVYDLKDYQFGMLSGVVLFLVGCYQLCKAAPHVFLDASIGFMIYKLSVVSSELDRRRWSNSLITRLLFGIIIFMFAKEHNNKYVLLDVIRVPLYLFYLGTFIFDMARMKKYGRRALISFIKLLKTRGGIKEIFRIVWYPGYVSPYDDGF